MPEVQVVLVEPRIPGNVGAVARCMVNFGLERLVLVRPCELTEEAFQRATSGRHVLESAYITDSLEEALSLADVVVGTTAIPAKREKAFHRQALAPREVAERLAGIEGRVALVFGREDYGLYNEELNVVDILVTIPTNPEYPVLNISHAASILFYELYQIRMQDGLPRPRQASGFEKERLYEAFDELLNAIHYPKHKRRRTKVMFRRLMGRAVPSKWEFHALMGVIRGATKTIRRLSGSPGTSPSS